MEVGVVNFTCILALHVVYKLKYINIWTNYEQLHSEDIYGEFDRIYLV